MSPPPRSLTFAVSTSLLTASLSLAGCDDREANPGPDKGAADKKADEGIEEDHVNVGPETPPKPEPQPELEEAPQPVHVNEGPVRTPDAPEPETKVNPGPEVEKPGPPLEDKRVNTRPSP
jgi:hypothetical protein